jgi:RNA polymerase sigma factor for flagellar operon FliA
MMMQRSQAKNAYGKSSPKGDKIIDSEERNDLIVEYAPLVKFVANRIAMRVPPSVSLDDLISAGIMGLLDAVDRFDPSRQVQFKTYAEFRIRGAILDELRSMDWVPRSTRKKIHDMEKAVTAVEGRLKRPADDLEIAEEMDIDVDTYYGILNKARGVELLSLDEYLKDDRDNSESKKTFKSLIRGNDDLGDHIMASELKRVIAESLETLSEKEQMVLSLYYYDELTLREIGEVLDLTESRISQIHTKAVIKLRPKLKSYCDME